MSRIPSTTAATQTIHSLASSHSVTDISVWASTISKTYCFSSFRRLLSAFWRCLVRTFLTWPAFVSLDCVSRLAAKMRRPFAALTCSGSPALAFILVLGSARTNFYRSFFSNWWKIGQSWGKLGQWAHYASSPTIHSFTAPKTAI